MGKLSGSKMDLARKCLHPFTSEAKWPKRTSDSSANLGLAFHRVVELHLSGEEGSIAAIAAEFGLDENDAIVLARMFDGFLEDPAADPSGVLAEQAYVFDARTGEVRHLGRIRGREYGHLERWEIACTVDAVIDHGDGTGAIVDWKTGRQRHLVPARDNRQVAFGSMCAAKAHGWTRVKGRLSLIDEDGSVRTAERDLDEYAIDGVEAEVRRIVEEIQLAPEPAPGLHCALLRCPYVTECRESTSALAEIAGDTLVPIDLPASVRYPLTGEIENEDQAIFFMHRLAAAKKAKRPTVQAWVNHAVEDDAGNVHGLTYERLQKAGKVPSDPPARATTATPARPAPEEPSRLERERDVLARVDYLDGRHGGDKQLSAGDVSHLHRELGGIEKDIEGEDGHVTARGKILALRDKAHRQRPAQGPALWPEGS